MSADIGAKWGLTRGCFEVEVEFRVCFLLIQLSAFALDGLEHCEIYYILPFI